MRNLNAMEWQAFGQCLTITTRQIMKWCGVSDRTARRWISSPSCIPEPARRLITLCALGGVLPLEWRERGYRFWGEYLHTNNGHIFNPAHLEHYEQAYGMRDSLSRTIDQLRCDIRDHREYIHYLESLVRVADVIKFDRSKARPSITDGKQTNSLFHKPELID